MNKLDTALVVGALKEAGYSLTESIKEADIVLINTCSVRQHAEDRVFSHLGHLEHINKNQPDLVVGVIGCMAQRLGAKLLENEAVDIVCGPAQIPQITQFVSEAVRHKVKKLAVTENIRQRTSGEQNRVLDRFESGYITSAFSQEFQISNFKFQICAAGQAYVRVMRGCNNFCSYCVVPFVRGPEVSRPPAAILEQIRKLADVGIRQVTLLGQRVNAYKYAAGEKIYCLADLLWMASDIEGIEWLKFVTSYPSEQFFDEILQAIADSSKVCNYLHMPAQSGSDKILRTMNRHYTAGEYLQLLEKARAIVPDIAIAGDFIVGFPGEMEEDFQATVELAKKARYKNCFVFKFSPRPGTSADKRSEDNVPAEVKARRNSELLAVQEKVSGELNRTLLGKEVKVLVEGLSKKSHLDYAEGTDGPQLVGRTATDHIVVFNGPTSLSGQFAKVKIVKTSPLTLFGKLI
jgi:tRNA-2-methylthio-N6-dimethylallyladenosine synthase